MKILQSIYTSCRIGQSGNSGFQFYSYSDGLTDEELLEIGRIGNYIAPSNLPSNPTQAEIETLFPVSFSYFRLNSGRVGVIQSVALTQDYSGRPGNFLAHAFVLESGEFPFLPVMLYKSTSFKTDLSAAEWSMSTVPEKLPGLEIISLAKNPDISLDSVRSFLEDNDSDEILPKLVNAVIENSETNRRIILSDNSENALFWIVALSFSFPLKLANLLTFTTYSIDPTQNNFVIAATSTEGNRFDFYNDMAYKFQFYIFNFALPKFSPIEYFSIYADIANTALSISYDQFEKLQSFFNNYNYPAIKKDIDVVYKLFAASGEGTQFNGDWQELLQFMLQHAKDESLKLFITAYKNYLEKNVANIYLENQNIEKFFSLLVDIIKRTRNRTDLEAVFELYQTWLYESILSEKGKINNQIYLQDIQERNELIFKQLQVFKSEFSSLFFTDKNIKSLCSAISDSQEYSFATYIISVIFQNVSLCQYDIAQLFKMLSFNEIKSVLLANSELKRQMIFLCTNLTDKNNFISILIYFSADLPPQILLSIAEQNIVNASSLYSQVKEIGNRNLLLDLFSYFQANNLITKTETEKLIQFADKEQYTSQLPHLIEQFEKQISIEKLETQEYDALKTIHTIKAKRSIATANSICELSMLLLEIKRQEKPKISEIFKSLTFDLKTLPNDTFQQFIPTFFRLLIPLIDNDKDYYYIFLFITNCKLDDTIQDFRDEWLNYYKKNPDVNAIVNLIQFCIDVFTTDKYEIKSKLKIKEFVATVLAKTGKSVMTDMDNIFSKKRGDNLKEWEKILEQANEIRNNTFAGKVDSFFSSFFKRKEK
ncbi:MAG: hypothetical protein LBH04_06380 [Tannerellaceae bacterium]|nr:hypothetical protein [Tannerellaceae bacterium]